MKRLTKALVRAEKAKSRAMKEFEKMGIQLCQGYDTMDGRVQVHAGIGKLATLYGCQLTQSDSGIDIFPISLSFTAGGYTFFAVTCEDAIQRTLYGYRAKRGNQYVG